MLAIFIVGTKEVPGLVLLFPWSNFFSFSCNFRQKSCQIIGFYPKLSSWRPRLGNPGSATAFSLSITMKINGKLFYFLKLS